MLARIKRREGDRSLSFKNLPLPEGAERQAVRFTEAALNRWLREAKRDSARESSVADLRELNAADEFYDAGFTAAVKAFQRDHGLPQIGRIGPRTARLLLERYGEDRGAPSEVSAAPLAPPVTRDDLDVLQESLRASERALPEQLRKRFVDRVTKLLRTPADALSASISVARERQKSLEALTADASNEQLRTALSGEHPLLRSEVMQADRDTLIVLRSSLLFLGQHSDTIGRLISSGQLHQFVESQNAPAVEKTSPKNDLERSVAQVKEITETLSLPEREIFRSQILGVLRMSDQQFRDVFSHVSSVAAVLPQLDTPVSNEAMIRALAGQNVTLGAMLEGRSREQLRAFLATYIYLLKAKDLFLSPTGPETRATLVEALTSLRE